MVILNISFAYFYNSAVSKAFVEAANNDYAILQQQNALLVEELKKETDISQWDTIIEPYEEYIVIYDNTNQVVAKTDNGILSALDVKVRTPFEFKGEAYLLRTSVYFLRDYDNSSRVMAKFIAVEALFVLTALFILIMIIYSFMLRPFRVVYKAIEEYDRSGKLMEIKLKGFAGRVYRRFAAMAKNVESQQQNERRIIASISHDIKTPLTSIMGYSEQLKKDNLSSERREKYIELGISEINSNKLVQNRDLSDYINDLLDEKIDFQVAANLLLGDISAYLNKEEKTIEEMLDDIEYNKRFEKHF